MIATILALVLQAGGVPAAQTAPPRRQDSRTRYDECLIDAAGRVAEQEADPVARYRLYALACGDERAALIDALVRGGSPAASIEERRQRFVRAANHANERAAIWAVRMLDPGPVIY